VFVDALAAKFTGPQCQAVEAEVAKTKARLRGAQRHRESDLRSKAT
jgi:hypothetical protein